MSELSEFSDADRQEQSEPVVPPDSPIVRDFEPEAPEADAVEQALPAPLDEDEFR